MPTTRPLRPALALAAAAFLLASPRTAPAAAPEGEDDGRVKTTSGKIARIDRTKPELVVETADGPLTLSFDRNTTVFLDRRLGTLRDLDTGTPVRTGYDVARKRAHWIEVRRPGATENPAVREAANPPSLPPPPGTEAQAAPADEKAGPAPGNDRPPDTTQPPQPSQPPDDPMPPLAPGPGRPTPDPVLPPGTPGSGR